MSLKTRGLIVEVSPVSENTSIAHVRNSLYLAKKTGFDICWNDETILMALKKQYDIILFSYSSKFAPHELMQKIIERNKSAKIMWMINEYNGSVPKCVRDAGSVHVLANFDKIPGRAYEYVEQWKNVDLNTWIMPETQTLNRKKYQSVYYGTYRAGRAKYAKKYLQNGVYCSSSAKNHKFYRADGCNPVFIEKLSWKPKKETLSLFNSSLYIEDEFTHKHYNRMSNRFYEALFCNVVPCFDVSCSGTIEKSGYDIPDEFVITTHDELINMQAKQHEQKIKSLFDQAVEFKKTETNRALEYIYA